MRQEKNSVFLPLVPLRGVVAFPGNPLHFEAGRRKTIMALNQAMESGQTVYLATQKDVGAEQPNVGDLHEVGVVAHIEQILRGGKDMIHVVVKGLYRARICHVIQDKPFFMVEVEKCEEIRNVDSLESSAMLRSAVDSFAKYSEVAPFSTLEVQDLYTGNESVGVIADRIAANMRLDDVRAQEILSEMDVAERMEKLLVLLESEIELLELENSIQAKVKEHMDRNQREYYLREQIKVISSELGDGDSPQTEAEDYTAKIKALHLDGEIEEKLLKECNHLSKMPFGSQEATVIRNYLDTCLDLPWNEETVEEIDLAKAEKILERDHYGLKKVKERMLEMLAVRKLAPDLTGQIICLVGPPGVGKTSIARSIAEAINRKYVRVSLGGVRDEAEIRGHRKTYIGSMPGRIMDAMRQAKSKNPLILLDEIDKLSGDFHGDPAAALLELLDSEQNKTFHDHYIDLPFDMSRVLFITTANDQGSIPAPLLDRMELIPITSYTHEEKYQIAKKHLLPKQIKNNGLAKSQLRITEKALRLVIDGYTKEAGVRTLERTLATLCRKAAKQIVAGETEVLRVNDKNLEELLGARKFLEEESTLKNEIGVANGMAWTSVGGELLPVEVAVMEGSGKLELTGSLGDVMKESAQAAVSYIRAHAAELKVDPQFYKKDDIHIHVPEGAVPKDGPSAGITLATAVVSALTEIPVRGDVAMTGEITLRGRVLPIGGLREKTMAAYRHGMKTVLIPKDNVGNLDEVEDVVKEAIKFHPVETLDQVLQLALQN